LSVPAEVGPLQEIPTAAAAVFGDRLDLARDFAHLLATVAVERGLVGPREAPRLWTRHLLNSAAAAVWIPLGVEVVDLGSGAGLPGIPLALARPDLVMTLVEPTARRAAFLEEAVATLGIDVTVRRVRGEELPPSSTDVVVARAVAPLMKLIPLALPLLRPGGRLVALKGENAQQELSAAAPALTRWPWASASVVSAAAGAGEATAVMIGLDDTLPDGQGLPR
jgi:16S rRNA (guanine527-N7)-methyltransferase